MSTGTFNRACSAATLLFILTSHLLRGPSYQDFPQYYMGGLMARTGNWDSIYPRPLPHSIYNAGWSDQSIVRARYLEQADAHGIGEFGFRFIQSPPVAVLFIPLTLLEYPQAYRVWMVILALVMWLVAVQAGRIYVLARGSEDKVAGVIMLVVGCSVLAYRAVRVGNVSPIVGLCIGTIALDLARPGATGFLGGAALSVGALAKYATPVLVPLHLVSRRWKPLFWAAGLMLGLVAATWTLSGSGPFIEFARDIAPTLGRSHPHPANQSIEGLLLRVTGHATLPPRWSIPLRAAQTLALILIIGLIIRRRRDLAGDAALVFAAAATLISWLLIFGPLYWEHYPVYLCPLWGWLAFEARGSRARLLIVIAAIAMAWVPVPAIQWIRLPEPINSHILGSTLLIMGLGIWRLGTGTSRPARAGAVDAPG